VISPLHQLKADFFKTIGHPTRIRVLELLSVREHSVSEMLPLVQVRATNLSQQLAVLRRAGLVRQRRDGTAVFYSLTSAHTPGLMTETHKILTAVLSERADLLATLRDGGV